MSEGQCQRSPKGTILSRPTAWTNNMPSWWWYLWISLTSGRPSLRTDDSLTDVCLSSTQPTSKTSQQSWLNHEVCGGVRNVWTCALLYSWAQRTGQRKSWKLLWECGQILWNVVGGSFTARVPGCGADKHKFSPCSAFTQWQCRLRIIASRRWEMFLFSSEGR
jgi:hypothetical protein